VRKLKKAPRTVEGGRRLDDQRPQGRRPRLPFGASENLRVTNGRNGAPRITLPVSIGRGPLAIPAGREHRYRPQRTRYGWTRTRHCRRSTTCQYRQAELQQQHDHQAMPSLSFQGDGNSSSTSVKLSSTSPSSRAISSFAASCTGEIDFVAVVQTRSRSISSY
jgi:hypothetical protein